MSDQSKSRGNLPTILLSILTGPFLVTIMVAEKLTDSLIEIGQASEEIFRGERLPVLNLGKKEQDKN